MLARKRRPGRGGEEAAIMAQIHVTPHRAARSLGEMWKGGCFLLPFFPHDSCSLWLFCAVIT
jgi:hypothetical protein